MCDALGLPPKIYLVAPEYLVLSIRICDGLLRAAMRRNHGNPARILRAAGELEPHSDFIQRVLAKLLVEQLYIPLGRNYFTHVALRYA